MSKICSKEIPTDSKLVCYDYRISKSQKYRNTAIAVINTKNTLKQLWMVRKSH